MNHLLHHSNTSKTEDQFQPTAEKKGTAPADGSLSFLVDLFQRIRPADPSDVEEAGKKFEELLQQLETSRPQLFALRKALLKRFSGSDITMALTESGMLSGRGFIQELGSKFKHKLLPELLPSSDFLYVIDRVFYKKKDYLWVEGVDVQLWIRFFDLIGIRVNLSEPGLIQQMNESFRILSHRLTVLALEKEFRTGASVQKSVTFPFLEQNRLVEQYLQLQVLPVVNRDQRALFAALAEALYNCAQSIHWQKESRKVQGTSLAETFLVVRMEQIVERMLLLLDVLNRDEELNTERFIRYFTTVIKNQNRKNSIGEFLSQNLSVLAYQISEHGGKKGEDYITVTKADFYRLFINSLGGGFIISFIAIFKNLLGKLVFTPFWAGIFYSINYSAGFIFIQLTGSTLATKQPAFTASAVAASLDSKKQEKAPDLVSLAITVAQVSRSQIASFAGNLLVVFPLTFMLAMGYHLLTGTYIIAGEQAVATLKAQHAFHSLALLYACFTGFFLFTSGLIAGWVENYIVYGRFALRVRQHPLLMHRLSVKQMNCLVKQIETKLGPLAGNLSLGFFLGMAGFAGTMLAIPFDIRHITIAAGNAAIAWYGLDQFPGWTYTLMVLISIGLIGFFNFLVSFALTFYVAVKSRGVQLRDYPEFIGILFHYFRKFPSDFLRPPRQPRTVVELERLFRQQAITGSAVE
jgi:site-specific recombinase